jgi:hypothetical protein
LILDARKGFECVQAYTIHDHTSNQGSDCDGKLKNRRKREQEDYDRSGKVICRLRPVGAPGGTAVPPGNVPINAP